MNIKRVTGGAMSDTPGNKQRLLIVDDSKVIRVTARKILRDHFETVEAVDGENAWEILNSSAPFSVIVSDLTMPNLDGFGLLERIRNSQQPHIREIPVIVITGANDSEAVKQRASTAGATDFIGKPFDSVHLLARTQAHASCNVVIRSLNEKMIEIEDQVLIDPLTGLANEVAFMERGFQQLSYAIRHDTSLSIFRVGIDQYGTLFKRHGQEITEAVIKTVANVLHDCIRAEDLVARTGTAHFSLLLPGMHKYGIRSLASRISRELDGRILKQGDKRVHISVSIGIVAPDIRRDTRFDEMLKQANKRLFQAIKLGGNRVVFEDRETLADFSRGTDTATVPLTVISDDAITEMITQSIDNGAELEEIVISTPVMSSGSDADWRNNSTVVENRAQQSFGAPSSRFAGPVPGIVSPAPATTAAIDSPANGTPSATGATPGAPTGRAVFTIDDPLDGNDESIVITELADCIDDTQHQPAKPDTVVATPLAEETSPASAGRVVRPVIITEAAEATEDPPASPGMFRRMLRRVGSLFGGGRSPRRR